MEKFYHYEGQVLKVRGGAWLDIMNSYLYTEVKRIPRLKAFDVHICKDNSTGEMFALLWG